MDPKLRRVKLSYFATMNLLPLEMPHMKVAGIKHAYSCEERKITQTYVEGPQARYINPILKEKETMEVAVLAEEVLRHFHVACTRGCGVDGVIQVGEGNGHEWTRFFANVDKEVYGVVFSDRRDLPKAEDKRRALEEAATRAQKRLFNLFPGQQFPAGPFQERVAGLAAPEVSGSKKQVLVPKLIQFRDGKPINEQET